MEDGGWRMEGWRMEDRGGAAILDPDPRSPSSILDPRRLILDPRFVICRRDARRKSIRWPRFVVSDPEMRSQR